jgi:hypothetical protein
MSLDPYTLPPEDDRSVYPFYADVDASALIWLREVLRRVMSDPHNRHYADDLEMLRDRLKNDEHDALREAWLDWDHTSHN